MPCWTTIRRWVSTRRTSKRLWPGERCEYRHVEWLTPYWDNLSFQRYANKSDTAKAIRDFEKALSIDPNHANAKKYLFEVIMDRAIRYFVCGQFWTVKLFSSDSVLFGKFWDLKSLRWLAVLLSKTARLHRSTQNQNRTNQNENQWNKGKSTSDYKRFRFR